MGDAYRERIEEWQRRQDKHDVAGECRAEKAPLPELANTTDPVLRQDATQRSRDAIQDATRAVTRALHRNVDALADRARRAETAEQRVTVRVRANRLLADADYAAWHPWITKILQMLEV